MDIQPTIDEVVRASGLPLSIIIIGVGSADFSTMEQLDADDAPLKSSSSVYATRDVVQFVPFNKYSRDNALLAKEVLKEIPRQMVNYFQRKNIKPNPPNPAVRAA